jgi:hypothetical protein
LISQKTRVPFPYPTEQGNKSEEQGDKIEDQGSNSAEHRIADSSDWNGRRGGLDSRRSGLRRRFTRLTNAFSKKLDNDAHMVALYALWYNFVRVHKSLRTSPAMAAGIETRLWSMEDVVRLIERREDLRSGALLVGSN